MARKSKRQRKAPAAASPRGTTDRDKAIDALMALLANHSFEQIGLAEVAGQAGINLSQLRAEFGSTLAMLAAHIKDIDRTVLAGGDDDMAEEAARERLFTRIDELLREVGIPRSLHEHGIAPRDWTNALPSLCRSAFADPSGRTNPRMPMLTELTELLEAGYGH